MEEIRPLLFFFLQKDSCHDRNSLLEMYNPNTHYFSYSINTGITPGVGEVGGGNYSEFLKEQVYMELESLSLFVWVLCQ